MSLPNNTITELEDGVSLLNAANLNAAPAELLVNEQDLDTRVSLLEVPPMAKATNQGLNQAIPTHNHTFLQFDTQDFDTANIFNLAAPTKFVVPAGYTKARITAHAHIVYTGALLWYLEIWQNTVAVPGLNVIHNEGAPVLWDSRSILIHTGVFTVTPGAFLEVAMYQVTGVTLGVNYAWCSVEFLK